MIGRWLMGLIAVVTIVLLPLRYAAVAESFTADSLVEKCLNEEVDKVIRDGRITPEDIQRMNATTRMLDSSYELEITRGERIELEQGAERYQYVVYAPEQISEELQSEEAIRLERGDTFTIRLIRTDESVVERLADTLIRGNYGREEYIGGGMFQG